MNVPYRFALSFAALLVGLVTNGIWPTPLGFLAGWIPALIVCMFLISPGERVLARRARRKAQRGLS